MGCRIVGGGTMRESHEAVVKALFRGWGGAAVSHCFNHPTAHNVGSMCGSHRRARLRLVM